tara:strand:- start:32 stop:475 length:444 start_codon:yes stop_codon:yes gene_type:complete
MKIKRITIKNVKSFKEKLEFELNNDFNVFIGPNAGGKSNFLDILTICMRQFFFKGFKIKKVEGSKLSINEHTAFGSLAKELAKYYKDASESEIELTMIIKEDDIKNVKNILSQIDLYEKQAKEYFTYPDFLKNIRNWNVSELKRASS